MFDIGREFQILIPWEYCKLFKTNTIAMWSIVIGSSRIITLYLPICREQAEKNRGQ